MKTYKPSVFFAESGDLESVLYQARTYILFYLYVG